MSSLSIELFHPSIRRLYFRNFQGRLDTGGGDQVILVHDKAYRQAWDEYLAQPGRSPGCYIGCPSKPLDLVQDEARRTSGDYVRYVLCDFLSSSDYVSCELRDEVVGSLPLPPTKGDIYRDSVSIFMRDDHPLWAFWIADCFDPPLYIVQADDFQSAYEEFVDHASEKLGIRIEDSDLADYCDLDRPANDDDLIGLTRRSLLESLREEAPERLDLLRSWYDGSFDSSGNPVDTESINCVPLTLIRLDLA